MAKATGSRIPLISLLMSQQPRMAKMYVSTLAADVCALGHDAYCFVGRPPDSSFPEHSATPKQCASMRLRGIVTVAWQLCTDTIDLGFALSQLGHMVSDVGPWTEMLAKITATVQIKVRRELVNPLKRSHTSWKGTQLGSSCRDGIMVRSKHRLSTLARESLNIGICWMTRTILSNLRARKTESIRISPVRITSVM